MEESQIEERNVGDNRARGDRNKVKREEKKDVNLDKIESQLLEEEQNKSAEHKNSLPLLFPPIHFN